jgi:hypothetical protein
MQQLCKRSLTQSLPPVTWEIDSANLDRLLRQKAGQSAIQIETGVICSRTQSLDES